MSTLFYGGAVPGGPSGIPGNSSTGALVGVLLTRVQLLDYQRVPIFQGNNQYLWTVHRLTVRGVYNPEVNAYDFVGGKPSAAAPAANLAAVSVAAAGGGFTRDVGLVNILNNAGNPAGVVGAGPGQSRGAFAPTTDIAIRDWMMQPQRQLVYAVGGQPVLTSPGVNSNGTAAVCDAHNGPVPLDCSVRQVSGTKTFTVDYSIETCVNEAGLYVAVPSVLVGHSYSRTLTYDQDYFATVITTGRATFRTDRLQFLAAAPDDFRWYFWQPKPDGFKRVKVDVTATEDGSACEYRIIDRETALSIVPNGVTRIECFHDADSAGVELEKLAGKTIGDIFDVAGGNFGAGGKAGFGAIEGAKLALEVVGKAMNIGFDFLPKLKVTAVARVWGRQNTFRKQLENVAVQLVLARLSMSVNPVALFTSGVRLKLTHDVSGTFVECLGSLETVFNELAYRAFQAANAPADPVAIANFGITGNMPNIGACFPAGDSTNGILDVEQEGDGMDLPYGANAADLRGPVPNRGTYVARLVAQALLAPHAVPPQPTDPGNGFIATPP